jgi:hypothetical protein
MQPGRAVASAEEAMYLKKIMSMLVAIAVAGGATAFVLSSMESAGAVGVTHQLVTPVSNDSLAVEKTAVFSFKCNDVTGKYTVSVKGVQVIKSDHVTPWETSGGFYEVGIVLTPSPTDGTVQESWLLNLTQNTTNGLFRGAMTGTLSNVPLCHSGEDVRAIGPGLSVEFNMRSPLT